MRIRSLLGIGLITITTGVMTGCGANGGSLQGATPTGTSASTTTLIGDALEPVSTALGLGPAFREDIDGSVGDHIIYSYNLFEGRNYTEKEKRDMLDYLEKVDAGLSEDLYVVGFTKMSIDGSYRFYARQICNGAVVSDVTYITDIDDPQPNIKLLDGTPLSTLDTSGVMDPKELIDDVEALANAHSSELCDYTSKGVYGDYILSYDERLGQLVYDFRVNEYSEVKLDAKTGSVVEEYYFNGDIPD